MRYFIRSVKYFLYFSLLTTVIILALVLLGAVEGDINTIFEGYAPFKGELAYRQQGSLISFETGVAVAYGLFNAQDRGTLFVEPGDKVYSGMVIGQTILALPIIVSWTAQAVENLDPRCRQTLLTLGAQPMQLALLTIREIRYDIGMVCVTAFGRVVTEVGVAMMLGGNIRYHTRTMTTAISLETSKGEFAQGIALGLVLLLIAFIVNAALSWFRQKGRV